MKIGEKKVLRYRKITYTPQTKLVPYTVSEPIIKRVPIVRRIIRYR